MKSDKQTKCFNIRLVYLGIKEWNPTGWANLFKQAGAGYVVLTSKHHDGFTLWPSEVKNPYRSEEHTHLERDIVGELGKSVRHAGMKYGLYYSGGFDWSFPGNKMKKCIKTSQQFYKKILIPA